ncbi:MAG: hypothetical protein FJX54_21060 [Alphaproteobacteria bacterium]|nr:hypothetical protein [Alphaproteobacteria bacterium]
MQTATPHPEDVLALIAQQPGISDREIAGRLLGAAAASSAVNPLCRELANAGLVKRRLRKDALLGNWLAERQDGLFGD